MESPVADGNRALTTISPLGNWVHFVDNKDYIFVVLTSPQYPQQIARDLLTELREKFYAQHPEAGNGRLSPGEVNAKFVLDIVLKYNKAQDRSHLLETQIKAEEIKTKIIADIQNQQASSVPRKVPITLFHSA